MPFTASHPAVVLPLLRTGVPPAALVVGSMVPDLPYFGLSPWDAGVTHWPRGIVTADVVLGLAWLLLWWTLLAPAVVAVAPGLLRRRLPAGLGGGVRAAVPSVRALVLTPLGLAVGAATHVLWDSFTHPARWGQQHVGWLNSWHGPLMGYSWAQHTSTLFGAAVLAAYAVRWWRRTPETEHERPTLSRATRLAAAGAVVIAGVLGAFVGVLGPLSRTPVDLRDLVFAAITRGGLLAGVAAVVVAALVVGSVRWRQDPFPESV